METLGYCYSHLRLKVCIAKTGLGKPWFMTFNITLQETNELYQCNFPLYFVNISKEIDKSLKATAHTF